LSHRLRILIVGGSEADGALVVRELSRGNAAVTFTRVEEGDAMRAAIADHACDFIIVSGRREDLAVAVEREIRQRDVRSGRAPTMEAPGRLASGATHDLNNVLTVIAVCSRLIEDSLDADDPRRADATEITKAAECGAAITRQLLTMSRYNAIEPRSIRIAAFRSKRPRARAI
jgi:signal transduction histidine kinase